MPISKILWLKTIAKVFVFLVLFLIIVGIGQSFVASVLAKVFRVSTSQFYELIQMPAHHEKQLIFEVSNAVIEVIIILLFQKFNSGKISLKRMGFSLKNKGIEFLSGAILGVFLISIGFVILKMMGFVRVISLEFNPIIFVSYLFFFLIVAFTEELLARGLILNILLEGFNEYVSLSISAFIFAGLHLMNNYIDFIPFLNLILAGYLLGVFYILRHSIMFPIGLHFTWNFFQGPVFGFEVSGHNVKGIIQHQLVGNQIFTGGSFGFEGSMIAFPMMLLGIFFIYKYHKTFEI